MNFTIHISSQEFKIVKLILEKNLDTAFKVWVFGSRAKNTARPSSDLDLALDYKEKIKIKTLTQLKNDFEDSKLPYTVDVLDINAVEPYFKKIIDKQKVPFPAVCP